MGKHHKSKNPHLYHKEVYVKKTYGSLNRDGRIVPRVTFFIDRNHANGDVSDMDVYDSDWIDVGENTPKHRIEDKSIRVVEVDVSDREDVQRLWRLERSRFGHKFFSIDANGKYNHNWCFEDSMEYYEEHGDFPDIIITMRHKDFMEEHEG